MTPSPHQRARAIVDRWRKHEGGLVVYARLEAAIAAALEEEIEACAKVLDAEHARLSKRAYPPPNILRNLAAAIRQRKGTP